MSLVNLSERYTRPEWVQRINAMGVAAGGAQRFVPIDGEAMCNDAIESTGLDDFGNWDGDWRGRLQQLIASIEDSAKMHSVGRLMTREEMMRGLRTRLYLANAQSQQPLMLQEHIKAPVVITGPARSGTSLLFELLDLDPTLHGPRPWECAHPFPQAGQTEALRKAITECEVEFWSDVQPEFAAIHDLRTDIPQECIHLQIPSFSGMAWPMVADVPAFPLDLQAATDFHRMLLQCLQFGLKAQYPERQWVLKTPVYLLMLDMLFNTYPDAWVIHTHRDPVKTAVSGASTLGAARWLRSDDVPVASLNPEGMNPMLLHVMQQRLAGELPERIIDARFQDLMNDPVGLVGGIYDQMGREFLGEHADAIRAYIARRPKGALGVHKYTATEWGVDANAVYKTMEAYTDHHQIELEN